MTTTWAGGSATKSRYKKVFTSISTLTFTPNFKRLQSQIMWDKNDSVRILRKVELSEFFEKTKLKILSCRFEGWWVVVRWIINNGDSSVVACSPWYLKAVGSNPGSHWRRLKDKNRKQLPSLFSVCERCPPAVTFEPTPTACTTETATTAATNHRWIVPETNEFAGIQGQWRYQERKRRRAGNGKPFKISPKVFSSYLLHFFRCFQIMKR